MTRWGTFLWERLCRCVRDRLGGGWRESWTGKCSNRVLSFLIVTTNVRLRREGAAQFGAVGSDLEARCRSYVEYAADQCTARVNSLAAELERQGRGLLGQVQEECMAETVELVERTTEEEERRLRRLGESEEARLRSFYEEEGKVEEKNVLLTLRKEEKKLSRK